MRVFDVFPFFNELDVLEIRLNELDSVVDKFVILECHETYGGTRKPLYLKDNWARFEKFHHKIVHCITDTIYPPQKHSLHKYEPHVNGNEIRTIGRLREANQREDIMPFLLAQNPDPHDIIIFSDCDEIPSKNAVEQFLWSETLCARFKQRTFYYNVNTLIDYGRDICSRARITTYDNLTRNLKGSLYTLRMAGNKDQNFPAIENGGWHFSYFGGDVQKLKEKVAALSPFLLEYKLFGDEGLVGDINARRDLHRRSTTFSELPEVFAPASSTDPTLPQYFLDNPVKFEHFTSTYFMKKYRS